MLAYEDLLAAATPIPDVRRGGDSLAGLFYTGGTTGFSKGVMLSHTNLVTSAMGCTATGEFVSAGGTYLHAAPMFHAADQAGGFGGALVGVTHVIIPGFDPKAVLDAIAVHGVTDVLLVPTMIQIARRPPRRVAVRPEQLSQPRLRRLGHRRGRARAHEEEPAERAAHAGLRDDGAVAGHHAAALRRPPGGPHPLGRSGGPAQRGAHPRRRRQRGAPRHGRARSAPTAAT